MNLWLRLLWLLLTTRFKEPIRLPDGISKLEFRVWPNDLDVSAHMNNGRYLALMDLGRTDIMLRSGLWREAKRLNWTPIASAVTIRFRRELTALQRFRLETRLACWDDTLVVMEQTFVIASGARAGQVAARALFKGGLYDRSAKRFVPIATLMQTIGLSVTSPALSPEIEAFLQADGKLKEAQ